MRPKAEDNLSLEQDAAGAARTKSYPRFTIGGVGILRVESSELLKTPEARRQIQALERVAIDSETTQSDRK